MDESDSDLRAFTAYFIAAIERFFPGACRNTQIMINSPNLPQLTELISVLLNELDRIEPPYIIVLDDYHLIKETMVHDFLTELPKHSPKSLDIQGHTVKLLNLIMQTDIQKTLCGTTADFI